MRESRLLLKYPIRIALNPFVSTVGWVLPSLISGAVITSVVLEVTDDKSLGKAERKRLQVATAPHKSDRAKMLKIADKTANLKSIQHSPPPWPPEEPLPAGWKSRIGGLLHLLITISPPQPLKPVQSIAGVPPVGMKQMRLV